MGMLGCFSKFECRDDYLLHGWSHQLTCGSTSAKMKIAVTLIKMEAQGLRSCVCRGGIDGRFKLYMYKRCVVEETCNYFFHGFPVTECA